MHGKVQPCVGVQVVYQGMVENVIEVVVVNTLVVMEQDFVALVLVGHVNFL